MKPAEVIAGLLARNPDALLLEPREVYDLCLVAFTDRPDDHWPRNDHVFVAVYNAETCIEEFAAAHNVDMQTSVEWFEFNTAGAWVGENTPTFRYGSEE